MKYPVVLIDLDDTLLDFGAASDHSLRSLYEELGHPLSDAEVARFEEINGACWKALERKEITRDQLSHKRFADFSAELGLTDVDPLDLNSHFRLGLSKSAVLIPGALELCRLLSRKTELYVVTNGFMDTQAQRIKAAGLEGLFKGVFASQAIGYEKPDPRYFDAVFEQIGRDKIDKTILLGDSLSSDMKGGKAYGLTTCWFNPKGKTDTIGCNHEIARLRDFLKVIGPEVTYRMAVESDIEALCDMALYFLKEKYPMTEEQAASIRTQRTDFLHRNLNTNIYGYMGFMGDTPVCSALLHVIEQPANRWHPNGRSATVLNVFTWPDYRRLGFAEGLMEMLMAHARTLDLSYVDLQAAPQAKALYEKLGFIVPPSKNTPMKCPMMPIEY
ncbi:MAG: YjjG family noncanonical pyrimidine nucleotidase [Clostridia bacterium]|nr:YjjG family noncanonical pyrimidine nucleotidase [Clostridia bacterium]